MLERIIIAHDYLEGSASSNRVLGFAKGYRDNGKEVYLVLFSPKKTQPVTISGVNVRCFNEPQIPLKLTRRLIAMIRYVRAIKSLYQRGNTCVHIYRTPWWGFLFSKRKYNFFFERGEIPFYSESKSIIYRLRESVGLRVTRHSTGLLAQTYSLRDFYVKYGVKNVEVINMFVDVDRFQNITIDKSTPYIAYCGTICKHKDGVDDLIKAFGIIHSDYPEYKLMLIGGFEAVYHDEDYLRNLVQELGITDSVIFTGKVSPSEIPILLANASILALARPINEQTQYGFPTKLGEYLCTGNPIVLTRVGEVCLYLTDHVNCVFAEPDNYEDFSKKLRWTITNYKEACILGEAGRKLVDTEFAILSQTQKAIHFMESVSNLCI